MMIVRHGCKMFCDAIELSAMTSRVRSIDSAVRRDAVPGSRQVLTGQWREAEGRMVEARLKAAALAHDKVKEQLLAGSSLLGVLSTS